MCPPLLLNSDGTLNESAVAYRRSQSSEECQTLRIPTFRTKQSSSSSAPRIMATSAASRPVGPLTPVSRHPSVRLPHEYVSATLPQVKSATPRRLTCASSGKLAELYRKCTHHEVSPSSSATTGNVSCRSVIMEYLECTAGER